MPTLTGFNPTNFLENTVNKGPQIIDADVTLTDAEGDFDGGKVVVSGLLAEDRITLKSGGAIAFVKNTGVVKYNGVVIGTATGGVGGDFTVTLNANATTAAVEALIEHLAYANTSDTPIGSRNLTLTVTDAAGNPQAEAGPSVFEEQFDFDNPFVFITVDGPARPMLFDYDNDDDYDLLVGQGDGTFRAWENVAGEYQERTGADNPLDGVDVGDEAAPGILTVDDDFPFLVIGNEDGELFALGFGLEQLEIEVGSDAVPAFFVYRSDRPEYLRAVGIGDDDDGEVLMVVGNGDGELLTFAFDDGGIYELTGADNPFDGIDVGAKAAPAFGDIDGDDDADLVVGNETGIRVWRNDDGVFTELTGSANPFADVVPGALPRFGVAIADLNDDGRGDLLLGDREGRLRLILSKPGPGEQFTIEVEAEQERLVGTSGGDDLVGTVEGDIIDGLGGTDFLDGGDGDDVLNGGAGDDSLLGGEGHDTLDGGAGADAMQGGAGSDTYYVDNAGDTVNDSAGFDVARSRVSWTMGSGVEELLLMAVGGAINGTGNELNNTVYGNEAANTIYGLEGDDWIRANGGNDLVYGGEGADDMMGGAGNDRLDGGAGADEMWGGLGNDTYYVDDEGDALWEDPGEGSDTIVSSVDFELDDDFENLTFTGTAGRHGEGNALRNVITGSSGGDDLYGGGENDTINGADGSDELYGEDGVDTLNGEDGDDVLGGGRGSDKLTGGGGADRFKFDAYDVQAGVSQKDQILDLAFADGDIIDLSSLFAGTLAFTAGNKFTKHAGEMTLKFNAVTNKSTLDVDLDGDGKLDLRIEINGNLNWSKDNLYTGDGDTDGGWLL